MMANLPEAHPWLPRGVVRLPGPALQSRNPAAERRRRAGLAQAVPRAALILIATRYPPRFEVDFDALADMAATLVEGALILGRLLNDVTIPPRQVLFGIGTWCVRYLSGHRGIVVRAFAGRHRDVAAASLVVIKSATAPARTGTCPGCASSAGCAAASRPTGRAGPAATSSARDLAHVRPCGGGLFAGFASLSPLAVTGDPTTGEHADTGRRFYLLFEGLRAGSPGPPGRKLPRLLLVPSEYQLAAVERREPKPIDGDGRVRIEDARPGVLRARSPFSVLPLIIVL